LGRRSGERDKGEGEDFTTPGGEWVPVREEMWLAIAVLGVFVCLFPITMNRIVFLLFMGGRGEGGKF